MQLWGDEVAARFEAYSWLYEEMGVIPKKAAECNPPIDNLPTLTVEVNRFRVEYQMCYKVNSKGKAKGWPVGYIRKKAKHQ